MRRTACATFVLVLPLLAPSIAETQERILPVPVKLQNTLVWCWAASAAMVIEYEKGHPIIDCEVLDAYDRFLGGMGGCCQYPARCGRGAIPGEIELILLGYGISIRSQPYAPPLHEIQAHLNGGHPLIIWLWRTPTSAHVVTIAGYRGIALLVHDPLQGALWVEDHVLRANWLTGVWRDTIFVDGRPVTAHWCCTRDGRFGPYLGDDVPVGAPCHWQTRMGIAYGTACN